MQPYTASDSWLSELLREASSGILGMPIIRKLNPVGHGEFALPVRLSP